VRRDVPLLDWDSTSERLIALVRLALAAGSLTVIWIDPTQPAKYWPVAYATFILYVAYSAVIAQLARTGPRPWLPLTTQVVDLLWILPVVYFTEAANTPFFVFFVTFTLSAGLRWGLWASWAVTVYSLVVYGALLFVETPTPLDLNNDLMRIGYLLIVGVLGGYLTEYRRRRERELRTLRTTSEMIGTKYTAAAALAAIVDVAHADALADAVVGVIREPVDGDLLMVRGAADIKRLSREEAAPFLAAIAAHPPELGPRAVELTQTDDVILRFADADGGVAYPIRAGDDLVGAIIFLFRSSRVRRKPSDEFLNLLLRHVIPHIETLYVLEQAPQARVMEERRRIARDLHDSFIQVLAALGLRLDVLSAATPATPAGAEQQRRELAQIREVIAREQHRVRAYVAEMREPVAALGGFRGIIEQVTEAFRARTRILVDVEVRGDLADLSGDVIRELAPLLREALTNVEKHARASRVTVSARAQGRELVLTVRDDGIGIGRPDCSGAPDILPPHGQGLSSMRERAQLLGGTFTVEPVETGGTALTVSIPLSTLV
jgi:signal transduction histidine kinase